MEREELGRLEAYLKKKFNPGLRLVARKEAKDSVELHLAEEFLAVVYKDTEEGETSYSVNMVILAEDLEA